MRAIETEVKFRIRDVMNLERNLQHAGFERQTPRTFERNVLYDTPDRRLRNERQILRIRQYGDKWVLTHKALPVQGDTGPYKQRVETETTVGDGDMVAKIFASLGFMPAFTYEKWRTEWSDATGHCVLDETPIGLYAELEGPEDWIDRTAAALGVHRSEFMNLSYGRLFELWKQETESAANDLTFEAIGEGNTSWVPSAIEQNALR
ncbi:adenylate cyclase [Acidisarcina polymorpha]|uniref:Adenylate cyclase n=1 Tax=Acidisarcina polymorpha TaxID=2211140 RepID=A0A2Z5G804_9BACT|nr:class IV adenylate cyclase [Acidisarcina polymorpha]AXC15099.1 adenylate cyclase [Acidisarcina polymorpha]